MKFILILCASVSILLIFSQVEASEESSLESEREKRESILSLTVDVNSEKAELWKNVFTILKKLFESLDASDNQSQPWNFHTRKRILFFDVILKAQYN